MTSRGHAVAAAALRLIGCRFRLHGRDPATGLDCVGVVGHALAVAGARPVTPRGYGLRNVAIEPWLDLAAQSDLEPTDEPVRAGDVLLLTLGYAQHHLVIATDGAGVVHAHAGLRRVVWQPREPDWKIAAHWRPAPSSES